MKIANKTKITLFTIPVILIVSCVVYWNIENNKFLNERKNLIIGSYVIDLERTNLGIYSDSIDLYKNLTLTFHKNMTFVMNQKVPFIADSSGIWEVGGMNKWCVLYYTSFVEKYNKEVGDQFTVPYLDNGDRIMYINSLTPQASQLRLTDMQRVYFKKILNTLN